MTNLLQPPIRQLDVVGPGGLVSVPLLVLAVVVAAVVILNCPVVVVGGRSVGGLLLVGGALSRSGKSNKLIVLQRMHL